MSVKLSSWVWDGCAASGMKLSSVAIMARLADFSSDEGVCWPSVETIARQLGAGISTVRTAIARLESEGWLTRTMRRNGNRNASNVYQLNVSMLRAAALSHQPESDPSESDASKSDPSKFETSKSGKNAGFHPPESGGDPSVNSKQDPSINKTSRQVPVEPDLDNPDSEVSVTDQAIQVLNHLNQISGSRFQKSKSSLESMRGRLRDGFSSADLMLVVDYKHEHWRDTTQYDYFQPVTLFSPSKFEGYLQSATRWADKGRPGRETWRSHADSRSSDAFRSSYADVKYTKPAGFR